MKSWRTGTALEAPNDCSQAAQNLRAARRFNRRLLLASGMSAVALGPFIVRNARSSSGELSILHWSDELPDPIVPNFETTTGIKVKLTPFSQNEEQIELLTASKGVGFDLCQPTRARAPQFRELAVLRRLDVNKLTNLGNVLPAMLESSKSLWTWDDGLYHLPHCWGSEAISWRTDITTIAYSDLSYGTLWEEQYRGKVQGRPHSLLLGIGLWLDYIGKLPTNRMADAFKDEETMRRIYDEILTVAIEHISWIRQFWSSSDETKTGLMENGVVIGQTWDGPALTLKKHGAPVSYMAPQEGAITWVDGWALSKGAKNLDQAYEWLNYVLTPEVSAQVANGSSYNPVVAGADALLSEEVRANFSEAYPEDALDRLWPQMPEPPWYAARRLEYGEKLQAAWAASILPEQQNQIQGN